MNKSNKANHIAAAVLFTGIFACWAALVMDGRLQSFDLAVQSFFFGLRCPALNAFGCALEYVGHWPLPAAVCLFMLLNKKTTFSYGLPMSACVLTSVGMYELLKHVFKRPRPDSLLWLCQEHGFSFPSGHTLNNTVFWVVFASLLGYYAANAGKSLPIYKRDRSASVYPKTKAWTNVLRVLLIAWPLIIGMSRILVGVHWPSDVVGSIILAGALINAAYLVLFYGGKRSES